MVNRHWHPAFNPAAAQTIHHGWSSSCSGHKFLWDERNERAFGAQSVIAVQAYPTGRVLMAKNEASLFTQLIVNAMLSFRWCILVSDKCVHCPMPLVHTTQRDFQLYVCCRLWPAPLPYHAIYRVLPSKQAHSIAFHGNLQAAPMAYLWDHRVQGTILVPAAMLLEVATCSASVCIGKYKRASRSRSYDACVYTCVNVNTHDATEN